MRPGSDCWRLELLGCQSPVAGRPESTAELRVHQFHARIMAARTRATRQSKARLIKSLIGFAARRSAMATVRIEKLADTVSWLHLR